MTTRLSGTNWGALFSSESMEWETPPALFAALDEEFGFTLDVCARAENAKCPRYYSPEDDGLAQPWEGVCWCNPPYGREIAAWMEKAYRESRKAGCVVVCLVPARTDTAWFQDWGMRAAELRFVRGRVRFLRGAEASGATFPSVLLVFRADSEGPPATSRWDWPGLCSSKTRRRRSAWRW